MKPWTQIVKHHMQAMSTDPRKNGRHASIARSMNTRQENAIDLLLDRGHILYSEIGDEDFNRHDIERILGMTRGSAGHATTGLVALQVIERLQTTGIAGLYRFKNKGYPK